MWALSRIYVPIVRQTNGRKWNVCVILVSMPLACYFIPWWIFQTLDPVFCLCQNFLLVSPLGSLIFYHSVSRHIRQRFVFTKHRDGEKKIIIMRRNERYWFCQTYIQKMNVSWVSWTDGYCGGWAVSLSQGYQATGLLTRWKRADRPEVGPLSRLTPFRPLPTTSSL